jgi:hypothetical protein
MKLLPEPPLWLGACLAALFGAAFVAAAILFHYLVS